MSRNRFRSFAVEQLEERSLMAGDVTAALVGNTIRITGDADHNGVWIRQIAADQYRVEGANNTTVNGGNGFVDFNVKTDLVRLQVSTKEGDDLVVLGDMNGMKMNRLSIDTG